MDKQPIKAGQTEFVVDAKGRKRGLKVWVICPVCVQGRWVRVDSMRSEGFTGMCNKCHNKFTTGIMESHSRWKGGRGKQEGYVTLRLSADDPYRGMARKRGLIREHRLVMAQHLGRLLAPWEVVHHKNGIRDDNRIENLELLPTQLEHLSSMAMQERIQSLEDTVQELRRQLDMGVRNVPKKGPR